MPKEEMNNRIEELMQKDYWIIDIMPKQVPKGSAGQYFAIIKNGGKHGRISD